MTVHHEFDWADYIEAITADIFGAANDDLSRPPENVRFGNKGSVKVDYTAGTWWDFEKDRGGGVRDREITRTNSRCQRVNEHGFESDTNLPI
jgi:hypothetical protein